LAWWSLILDLTYPLWAHVLLFVLIMGGPFVLIEDYYRTSAERLHWRLSWVFLFQASWVLMLCWSGVTAGQSWPTWWRASLFLNVLHKEDGPARNNSDVAGLVQGRHFEEHCKDDDDESDSSLDKRSVSAASFSPTQFAMCSSHSHFAAGPLLHCLDTIVELTALPARPHKLVRQTRDELYEACRAAGVPRYGPKHPLPIQGFWLDVSDIPGGKQAHDAVWVNPSCCSRECEPEESAAVALDELLLTAHKTVDDLTKASQKWVAQDMEQLEQYGGEALRGVRSFLAQFQRSGSASKEPIGIHATRAFQGGTVVMSIVWVTAVAWSWSSALQNRHQFADVSLHKANTTLDGARLEFHAPQWLAPATLGCTADGDHLVLADPVGAHVMYKNGSGKMGPIGACGDAATVAADFGPGASLWVACSDGVRSTISLFRKDSVQELQRFPLGFNGIRAMAFDVLPPTSGRDSLEGLVVRNGRLYALQTDLHFGWKLAGSLGGPQGYNWTAVALRGGLAFVMDNNGIAFHVNTTTGVWRGPVQIQRGLKWSGICVLPTHGEWLALGHPADDVSGGIELWHFHWPALLDV